MMRRHPKLLILIVFLLVVAAVGLVVYQRIARPAQAMLLLPDGDLLCYVNFSPAHFFDMGKISEAETDPEYQDFVQNTGFHFEHDLDTIAVSMATVSGDNPQASSVFVGHFDQPRLTNYLRVRSSGKENYQGHDIFLIHRDIHTVRVAILDAKTVAVTNMESSGPMHGIIDKWRNPSLIGHGPLLLANYYDRVPFGSLLWLMFRAPEMPGAKVQGFDLDVLKNTVAVASVRYTGSIRFRLEIISANESDAQRVLEAANVLLVLAHGASENLNPGGTDKDVKAAFDSIQVQRQSRSTVLSIVIPQGFVQKMSDRMKQSETTQH